ncbi:MAG TPA: amidohydrolase/deacetylase family metallohydrolase [Chryseolinea sp.]|nr:amidohydrolase/deacetylase family metallohydrolase [Chryseolinea sp.]
MLYWLSRNAFHPMFLFFTLIAGPLALHAQDFDLLLKGGHVIDPKNNIDRVMDVAIADKKIAKVEKDIPAGTAKKVIDVTGLYVTPGLIDMHAHHFPNISSYRVGDPFPDGFTLRCGITTTVDAGSSGWKSFPEFKKQTIDVSKTRVLAWLNIVGEGFLGREPYEQNTGDMDPRLTALAVKVYKPYIIGVKVAHYTGNDFIPVDRAVEAGKQADVPVMVDFGEHSPPLSIEELFMKHFRPGDIFTHCFANGPKSRETIVDETGKVKPFVFEARKKGIIFDVGHGGGAFSFSQAIPAIEQKFLLNFISTDWNKNSTNGAMKDLLNVMSKFLAMGVDLQTVIRLTTMNPAKQIKREELGNLTVGSCADVAVFNLRKGNFGFEDVKKTKIMGTQKLEAELTIREGEIVWDLNGLTMEKWTKGK